MMKEKKRILMLLVVRLLFPAIVPSFVAAQPSQNEETPETPEDCKTLIDQKGRYIIRGTNESNYCVSMIMTEADYFIVANVTNLSVDCNQGFIELQDGIEIDSGTFPTERGLATINTCSSSGFVVSKSNVAQLLYGMKAGESFVIDVDFRKAAMPCDMLLREEEGRVIISNIHSNSTTCFLFFPFPIQLRIKMTNKSTPSYAASSRRQNGSSCPTDNVEVRGGEDISYSRMTSFLRICPTKEVRTRSGLLRSRNEGRSFMLRLLNGMDVGDSVGGRVGRDDVGGRGGRDDVGGRGGRGFGGRGVDREVRGDVGGGVNNIGGSSYDNGIISSIESRVRRMMERRNATRGETRMNIDCSFTKLKLVMSGGDNVSTVVEFRHLKEGEGGEGGMNYQC